MRSLPLACAFSIAACAPQSSSNPQPPSAPTVATTSSPSASTAFIGPAAAPGDARFSATPPRDVACGTDGIRRQPGALADLDRDGHLDRPSVMREGHDFVVRLHRIPGLATEGEWRIHGDYVEVATTRCRGTTNGDLWLHVGVAKDPKGNQWSAALYHLESGRLVSIADDITQSSLFIDTDGDGCVDPIVIDKQGARVRHGTQWERLDPQLSGLEFHGMPTGYGQQEAVDLDGDGDVDLLLATEKGLSIIDPKTWKSRWTRPGHPTSVEIGTWRGKRVIAFIDNDVLRVLDTDKSHTELISFKGASYWRLMPEIDPAGDGSVLAIKTLESALTGPKAPFALRELNAELAVPGDEGVTRLGPVLLSGNDQPSLVGVRISERGSPMIAFSGSSAKYDLVSFSGSTPASDSRAFFSGETHGGLSVSAQLVDLDGDGRYEVLVSQNAGYSSCDMKSSGSTAKLYLVDGRGNILWSDKERSETYDPGTRDDREARARPMDLGGKGKLAIRVRAGTAEWYVTQNGVDVPKEIPACLE